MNWHPHDLFHCFDSDLLAWTTIILCLGVLIGYIVIALKTWLPSLRQASARASRALLFMMLIFIFCAIAGYGTVVVAAFAPKVGYVLRVIFLVAVNIVNLGFLYSKHGHEFKVIGQNEALGQGFTSRIPQIEKMTDPELAELTRLAIKQSLGRQIGMT